MKKAISTTAVVLGLMSTTSAYAVSTTDRATVTNVEAQYQNVRISTPKTTCEVVQVPIYNNGNGGGTNGILGGTADALNGKGVALAGAIIGGVIGSHIGKGGGKDAATALGVIIGSNIGRNNAQANSNQVTGYRNVEQCKTNYSETVEQQLTGYKVTFDYNGLTGQYRSSRPVSVGDQIRVNVSVTPTN